MDDQLDSDLEVECHVLSFADKFKSHMTRSGSDKLLEEKINFETMKRSIKMEIENRIDSLSIEQERWKSYDENKSQFVEWLKVMEKRLGSISVNTIDLETPKTFQVSP